MDQEVRGRWRQGFQLKNGLQHRHGRCRLWHQEPLPLIHNSDISGIHDAAACMPLTDTGPSGALRRFGRSPTVWMECAAWVVQEEGLTSICSQMRLGDAGEGDCKTNSTTAGCWRRGLQEELNEDGGGLAEGCVEGSRTRSVMMVELGEADV